MPPGSGGTFSGHTDGDGGLKFHRLKDGSRCNFGITSCGGTADGPRLVRLYRHLTGKRLKVYRLPGEVRMATCHRETVLRYLLEVYKCGVRHPLRRALVNEMAAELGMPPLPPLPEIPEDSWYAALFADDGSVGGLGFAIGSFVPQLSVTAKYLELLEPWQKR